MPPKVTPLPPKETDAPPLPPPILGNAVAVGICRPTPVAAFEKSSIEGLLCLLFRFGVGL